MIHRKLSGLMSDAEVLARTAASAMETAESARTAPAGSISVPNSDGTRTVIGAVNTTGSTMATHVGDTTPPGVPTGVTAWSGDGSLHVSWDGTLTGGIPVDFDHVTLLVGGVAFARLARAGSATCKDVVAGTTVSVTATAEDDTCLDDGTPAHNVSAASAAVSVVVTDTAASLSKLIRETDDGVDVGKSADGTTYADGTMITRQGTDGSFSIIEMLSGVLASVARFAESAATLCKGRIGIFATADGETSNGVFGTTTPDRMGGAYLSRDAANLNGSTLTDPTVGAMGVGKDNSGNVTAFMCAQRLDVYGTLRKPTNVDMDAFATAICPTVLYNGGAALDYDTAPGAGTTGAITLSSSAANYKKMTIYFQTDDNAYGSDEVPFPDGKRVSLSSDWSTGADFYCKARAILISGTSITTVQAGNAHVNAGTMTADNVIRIVRVEGRR